MAAHGGHVVERAVAPPQLKAGPQACGEVVLRTAHRLGHLEAQRQEARDGARQRAARAMRAARLHRLTAQDERLVGPREKKHVGGALLPCKVAALHKDRARRGAGDDARRPRHGRKAIGGGIDARERAGLGDVGRHHLGKRKKLGHDARGRPLLHKRRPARGHHDRVHDHMGGPMAAQPLGHHVGNLTARQHADLHRCGGDILEHGVYLVGHELRRGLLDRAHPTGVLGGKRRDCALAVEPQRGDRLEVGLNARASRGVAAGDGENGRESHEASRNRRGPRGTRRKTTRRARARQTDARATPGNLTPRDGAAMPPRHGRGRGRPRRGRRRRRWPTPPPRRPRPPDRTRRRCPG